MVNNVIHATYTETYDINTLLNELSLLAIHTPQAPALKRMFHGFFEQYKKFKILGCNFRMVCATKQELSPDQAGSSAGQIDPRNVLNPILFKACTGEHIDALCDQIYNKSEEVAPASGLLFGSIGQHIVSEGTEHPVNAYYSLLADDSWRKEHPQRGITVMGLRPMVHKVVTTQPFKWSVAPGTKEYPEMVQASNPQAGGTTELSGGLGFGGQSGSVHVTQDPVNPSVFVSNGLTEMPWLDTSYTAVGSYNDGTESPVARKASMLCNNVPRVYMGCLVLPPSLGENSANLYYRIQINWHILFKDFRPVQDILAFSAMGSFEDEQSPYDLGLDDCNRTYFNMYHTASKLAKDYGSFDTAGVAEVDKIVEKGQ